MMTGDVKTRNEIHAESHIWAFGKDFVQGILKKI